MIEMQFPQLVSEGFNITSNIDPKYNCIAWAAEDNNRFWWPIGRTYRPANCPRVLDMSSFKLAFEALGYNECADGNHEGGYKKVAIYEKDGKPTHAARQLPDGTWTSKLGKEEDISHTLHGLDASSYGAPTLFMRKTL
jgi:hypothetical protein